MIGGSSFQNREPLLWIAGKPIYATMLLIVIYCAGMVFTAISQGVEGSSLWVQFIFSSESFLQGKWWQALTYPLINHPSLWFGIEMMMLYWFGSELEKYFGRKMFFVFYGILWIMPVWILVVGRTMMGNISYHGSSVLNFCVFAGFAIIYPSVELIFRIQARWLAAAIAALWVLSMLSTRSWIQLGFLLTSLGLTWILSKWNWESTLEWLLSPLRRPIQSSFKKVLSKYAPNHRSVKSCRQTSMRSSVAKRQSKATKTQHVSLDSYIDQILDKIAAEGIDSLSDQERNFLKRHSEELAKEDRELTK
jgi:hypothetical protein